MTEIRDQKKKKKREKGNEEHEREYLLCEQSIKIRCQWGDTAFTPRQMDLRQTDTEGGKK